MKRRVFALSVLVCFLLSSCDETKGEASFVSNGEVSKTDNAAQSMETVSVELPAEAVTGETEKTGDTEIIFKDNVAEVKGSGVKTEGNRVTIQSGGEYYLSGNFTGQLRVDVTEEKKVTLIFNGVSIACSDSAPLFILSSPKKTVISTATGSVNILADGGAYDPNICDETDGDVPDAALYSRDDLKITGSGELYVSSVSNRGINCKDDLEIENGSLYVESQDDAVRGKDSITVTGGNIAIDTQGDGFRSAGDETDAEKGRITIENGKISVICGGDAFDGETSLEIRGGELVMKTNGGHENGKEHKDEFGGGGFPGGGGGPGGMRPRSTSVTAEASTDVSAKGLKSAVSVTVSGGRLSLDCADDAVHSNGSVTVLDGSIFIKTGDDGLHADGILTVSGGNITVERSYEGAEGEEIYISGGTMRLTSSDDGINAGTSNGGFGFGGGNGTGGLYVSGGYTVLDASGDGIDSNNNVTMSGGTLIVYGPVSGANGPLDYDRSFDFSGGTLLAVGAAGMAQSVTSQEKGVIAFNLSVSANTFMNITDENSNSVICVKMPKNSQNVVFASDSVIKGKEYRIFTGGSSTGTELDGIFSGGEYSGGTEKGKTTAK